MHVQRKLACPQSASECWRTLGWDASQGTGAPRRGAKCVLRLLRRDGVHTDRVQCVPGGVRGTGLDWSAAVAITGLSPASLT